MAFKEVLVLISWLMSTSIINGMNTCSENCMCTTSISGELGADCSQKQLNNIPRITTSNIASMDLSLNEISQLNDHDFIGWGKNLKQLYLNNNYIKNVDSIFMSLPNLMRLHLDYNLITEIQPNAFHKNKKLWKLTLNGNTLALFQNRTILKIPSLGWLEMENCNILQLPVAAFDGILNVVVLRLSNNNIKDLHPNLFTRLSSLKYVHLEDNQIAVINENLFKSNHKLEWLYLGKNPLSNFDGEHFLHSQSLIFLEISFCNISKIPNKYFSNIHRLKSLRLNNNSLTSFNITHLPKTLEILDLSANSMTNIHTTKTILKHLLNLEHVDLSNNKFICDCKLYEVWLLCFHLSRKNGDMCGLDHFCPVIKFMNCDHSSTNQKVLKLSDMISQRSGRMIMERKSSAEEIDEYYRLNISGGYENNIFRKYPNDIEDTETNLLGEIYDDDDDDDDSEIGKIKVKSEDEASSVLEKIGDSDRTGKLWYTVLYSCIGFLGSLCLIGATVLGVETFLRKRKTRTMTSASSVSSTLRQVRLELMELDNDKHETRPLTHSQGFDFVSLPSTHVETLPHHGKHKRNSLRQQ